MSLVFVCKNCTKQKKMCNGDEVKIRNTNLRNAIKWNEKNYIHRENSDSNDQINFFVCINVRKRFANGLFQNEMHLLIGALTKPFEKSRTV